MRVMLWLGALSVLVCGAGVAVADWSDNFDSYADGSDMHGQGGWKGWDDDPQWTAYVSSAQAHSSPHSVDISGTADLVHEYAGATSGQWTYTAWQYIPTDFTGVSYFILLNTYVDGPLPPKNWSTQLGFDADFDVIWSDFEMNDLPIIRGQWVEIRVEIDLDTDWQDIYYGGQLLSGKSWTDGVSGGGALNIGAVDLFANTGSPVYYDDMSLTSAADCEGDIDGDGETGHGDLGTLLGVWGKCVGDDGYNPDADLDGDGCIGHGDLGVLLGDWGCGAP